MRGSVDTTRQDFIVGLVIVGAIAVVVGALLATSGWGERRYDLYLRAASAEGLTADSKVLLQGLEVGRVMRVSPRVDSTTRTVSFVAKLSMIERFSGGADLRLPAGTRGRLEPASQISSTVLIRIVLPDSGGRTARLLAEGDTIDSDRKVPVMDQVAEVAQQLSKEVQEVLHRTHQSLERVDAILAQANGVLKDIRPSVETTLADVSTTMGHVNKLVQRLDPGLADSVSRAIALSTRVLLRVDSLAAQAGQMTTENREDVRIAVANLTQLTRQLNHLAEQVSRRPYRLLTGVKPLPSDSAPRGGTQDSIP
ncbi:MAG TPA: MlaD family protein [Gemmatimonadales bacterium]|nr:MlaD family protein [Gemmatimonadales bacterium]